MSRPTNTRFAIAVHVLTLLAASPDTTQSSVAMAGSVGSNAVHVRRVLGLLRDAHLVTSRPGAHGGWLPACDTGTTTLADVWRAVYAGDPLLGLHAADPSCQIGQGVQRTLLGIDARAAHAVEAELSHTTLDDLVDEAVGRRAS